jgi:hypothetical protein
MRISHFALALVAASVLVVAGCSTAGPFITNISSDGKGSLVVEKAMIQYNGFTGTVSTKDHTSSTIQVTATPSANE